MSTPGTTLHPSLYRKKPAEVEAVKWGGGEFGAQAIERAIDPKEEKRK